ncbi:hypothetical protein KUTeg_005877 [Tegillarca granosa]|uniref:Uncharacterized protein n=1 Tax=Tegillarca granosa TaxID=220873 RepID=A0ABQ9FK77_TEGGR|nr:hypothetical protein KUTeg_005877 [Tegillarca granosa]
MLNEFDVELGAMIDDEVEDINKIESQNDVSSSDSSLGDKEHKEKKDSEDHVDGANPKKRSKLGSNLDVGKIRVFFEEDLKFKFELCEDFTKQQEHIFTADDEKTYIEFDTVFSCFKNDKINEFAGKPRVFLIQSCRGAVTQKTVDLPDEPPEDEILPPEDNVEKITIPIDSDTLIAHATTPGTKAFRRDNHVGAWFIDAFIEVCRGSYEEDHLEEIDMLNEFDVELGAMIDDEVEEINKIESQNDVSSSDSSLGDKEHKEKKDSEDHVDGANPKKRSKLGTDLDVEKIRDFFETDLKFEFELCEDFTKQQVTDKLEEYKNFSHPKGPQRGKPRVFLMQSCRDAVTQKTVDLPDEPPEDEFFHRKTMLKR